MFDRPLPRVTGAAATAAHPLPSRQSGIGSQSTTSATASLSSEQGRTSNGPAILNSWISSWNLRRSEEHTSELQSLMRISYAVFCLKKKKTQYQTQTRIY